MASSPRPFPRLREPPINEVVCGFVFEPAMQMDGMDFGVYWNERRDVYPRKELHPAVIEGGLGAWVHAGVGPMRGWLVSKSGSLLLQVQHDRFYMNWRALDDAYPHFSDRGDGGGLKKLALREFDLFRAFCTRHVGGATPRVVRVELSKIDVLQRGRHWSDLHDLGSLLKVATVFGDVQAASTVQLHLRLNEADGPTGTRVAISVDQQAARLDTHMALDCGELDDLGTLLDRANTRLNEVFFGLLEETELHRFGVEE